MIRLPNLDDQRYSDIVEAAKRRIPVIYPEWTDFNEHDPGITIIELFAWLKEMQQYYLNHFSAASFENMLRLLGIEVGRPQPATAEVRFSKDYVPETVIKGAEAVTADGTVFVSEAEFRKEPVTLGGIYLENGGTVHDITGIAMDSVTDFYPFGSQHQVGERSLYIGVNVTGDIRSGITLYFDIPDKCPVARNPAAPGCRLPRRLCWEYSTKAGFKPCTVAEDSTLALSFSGSVTLCPGEDFAPDAFGEELPSSHYFRVRLEDSGCEDMPALSAVYINRLLLTQKRRFCDFAEFRLDGSRISFSDKLMTDGLGYALVRDTIGWRYDGDAVFSREGGTTTVTVGGGIQPAQDGEPNLRIVFADEPFGRSKMFYSSDGLPGQTFDFHLDDEPLTETLCVMTAGTDDEGNPVWQDCTYVENLALAGPYDRAFTYDRDRHTLVFGDNENGEVPERGDDRIMVIRCEGTRGSTGNIRRGNLVELRGVGESFPAVQSADAAGGRDRETLEKAMDRLKLRMSECVKAVTAEDYRTLAMKTPGLRVADVKAIPFFDPDVASSSRDRLANTVTLVILPYSTEKYPMPDESFLAAVRDHIENYRMVTTNVKAAAPIYVKVDISAEVICTSREVDEVRRRVKQAIRDMFSVYHRGGTRFGEPVTEIAVMTEMGAVDGILSVRRLTLGIEDSRCYRDKYGRIIIPPHAIACPGRITIEVTEP